MLPERAGLGLPALRLPTHAQCLDKWCAMPTERSYSLLTPPDPNLLCPICHSVLKSPWMSVVCEHFYCRECILRSLESSALCPCDRQPLSEPQLVPAPRLVQLIVDELKVQCDDKRCTWRGQRSQWEKHPCAAALLGEEGRTEGKGASSIAKGSKAIPCKWSGCTAEFRRKTDILKHEESDCPFRMSGCNQCGESVSVGEVEVHLYTSFVIRPFLMLTRRAMHFRFLATPLKVPFGPNLLSRLLASGPISLHAAAAPEHLLSRGPGVLPFCSLRVHMVSSTPRPC